MRDRMFAVRCSILLALSGILLTALLSGERRGVSPPVERPARVDAATLARSPDLLMAQLAAAAHEPSSQQFFDALAALGPAALPALAEGLRHRDPHVRFQALLLVGRLTEIKTQRVPALVLALEDRDKHVSTTAKHLLRANGPASLPWLLPAMQHCRPEVRRAAVELVVDLDAQAAVHELADAASDDDAECAKLALAALEKLGPLARPAVPTLMTLAKREPARRFAVVKILAAARDDRARQVVPLLVKALADCPNGRGRAFNEQITLYEFFRGTDLELTGRFLPAWESLKGLALLGPLAAEAVPEVRHLLGKANAWKLHRQAVVTLEALGEDPRPFIPQLLAVRAKESGKPQRDDEFDQRAQQLSNLMLTYFYEGNSTSLERLELHDPAIVAQLLRHVTDKRVNEHAAVSAALALSALRPEHYAMLPRLKAALEKTNDETARIDLLKAVAKLGPVAIPVLREELAHLDKEPRDRALEELLRLTPRDPELIRLLLLRLTEIYSDREYAESMRHFVYVHQQLLGHQDVECVQRFLGDADPKVRIGALWWLRNCGFDSASLQGAFRNALDDPAPSVRALAARVNTRGSGGELLVPRLLKMLQANNEPSAALEALRYVGQLPEDAAPVLLEASVLDRRAVGSLLAKMAPAASPALKAGLKHANPEVRHVAIDVLASVNGRASVEWIRPLLLDANAQVRQAAAMNLARLDPTDTSGLHVLIEMLGDNNTLQEGARALALLGPGAGLALPRIEAMLADTEKVNQWPYLIDILVEIGPSALPILRAAQRQQDFKLSNLALEKLARVKAPGRAEDLCAVLEGGEVWQRARAAQLLGKVGPRVAAAEPALRRAMREDKPAVRLHAAIALAHIKGRDRTMAIVLTSLLGQTEVNPWAEDRRMRFDFEVDSALIEALLETADPATLPPLFTRLVLEAPRPERYNDALSALVSLGPTAEPHLRWLLRHPRQAVRQGTIWHLANWPGTRAELEGLLIPVTRNDPLPLLRDQALASLAKRQAAPELVLPWLKDQMTGDLDREERLSWRLTEMEEVWRKRSRRFSICLSGRERPMTIDWRAGELLISQGPGAVPILQSCLEHPNKANRRNALELLRQLGPIAKAALPDLHRLLERETDLEVRSEIRYAIERIVPPVTEP